MTDNVGADVGGDEWVTLADAVDRLGMSLDRIRRRIKSGDLDARREERPQGYRWLVRIPTPTPVSTSVNHQVANGTQVGATSMPAELGDVLREYRETIDRLQRETTQLAGQVGFLQGRLQGTQEQLQAAQERILLLEAPAPTHVEVPDVGTSSPAATAERLPWWRFWRRVGATVV